MKKDSVNSDSYAFQEVTARLCRAVSRRMMPDEPTPEDRMELREAFDAASDLLDDKAQMGLGVPVCSALNAVLALVDFGACRDSDRPQDWIRVASPIIAHCKGSEDVNLAAARIIAAEYRKLERERDEWQLKYIQQNKDLGHELRDPNGTIWDECKQLRSENKDLSRKLERLCGIPLANADVRCDDGKGISTNSESI